jgi:hypothetical protein
MRFIELAISIAMILKSGIQTEMSWKRNGIFRNCRFELQL